MAFASAAMARRGLPLFGCVPVAGCAVSPSIAVVGAYFPDWLFCLARAAVATAVLYASLASRGRAQWLDPVPVV